MQNNTIVNTIVFICRNLNEINGNSRQRQERKSKEKDWLKRCMI